LSDLIAQALHLLNAVWRRRWPVLAVAWCLALLGWAFVVSKPNVYTATTRIFVDTASVLEPLLQGLAVERDDDIELEVMRQTLTTRANLEEVARRTDLDLTAATAADMERLVETMRARTSVDTDGRFLMAIGFSDTDPQRAHDVVAALSDVFISSTLGQNRSEIASAEAFLERQIGYYERELDAAERRLAVFKQERVSALPGDRDYQFRLEELRAELIAAQANLQRALSRQGQLQRDLAAGPSQDVAVQIFETEQLLADLTTRYTELHPDVIAARRRLDRLRRGGGGLASAGGGPLIDYAEVKLQLGAADADVAVYTDQVEHLRARIERLDGLVAQIPDVEAELSRLNRDYDVLKVKYDELVARREQAKLSGEREAGVEQVRYEVVEPPAVPTAPDGPSRSVLLTFVLLAALAGGAGFGIVLNEIRQTFADPDQLRRAFGLPVLGTVTAVRSGVARAGQAAALSSFLAGLALLFAAYGTLVAAEQQIGLHQLVPEQVTAGWRALSGLLPG
jgi:polysaccharide chain length determinant protein (PEP-CTERM system associated)